MRACYHVAGADAMMRTLDEALQARLHLLDEADVYSCSGHSHRTLNDLYILVGGISFAGALACSHLISLSDIFATCSDLLDPDMDDAMGEDSFSLMYVLNGETEKTVEICHPSVIREDRAMIQRIN